MIALRAVPGVTGLATVAVVLAACSGGGAAASASPPPGVEAAVDARNMAFSASQLSVPAGEPFQLFFRNLDGAPHNVAIYADESAAKSVFVGEVVTDAATTYEVPAIEAGSYVFRCDVHPDMEGTVAAGS